MKDRLRIKIQPGVSPGERDIIWYVNFRFNRFRNQIRGILEDNTLIVIDIQKIESNMETTQLIFNIFIVFLGIIAFIISFFMLLVATTSNIKENMWEFGVLRAIGLRKIQITRIYLYEALAVYLSAALLGMLVGFILATTLSLQFNIFLELPFKITFPYWLVATMLILGLFVTILGTIIPLRSINRRTISSVLKAAG